MHNLFCRLRLDRTQPGVVDASPGQRIRLTCRAEGFPVPTIEWQRDGQLVSSPRFIHPPPAVLSCCQPHPSCGGQSRTLSPEEQGWNTGLLGIPKVWLTKIGGRPREETAPHALGRPIADVYCLSWKLQGARQMCVLLGSRLHTGTKQHTVYYRIWI